MKQTVKALLVVILICALLPGCATTSGKTGTASEQSSGTSDQTRTKVEGTAVGAVLGGLLGYALGEGKGAAIGAALGAGVGYLVGNEVAKRKQAYASTEEFLDAEIASTQEFNRTTYAYNEKLSQDIAQLDQEASALRAQYDSGAHNKKVLTAKRDDLQKRINENKKLEATLTKEVDVQTAILEQERKERPADDQHLARLEKEVSALQKNLETLRDGSTQLARIDQRLSV